MLRRDPLTLVAWLDAVTPYRFSLFVFYACPIFVLAYRFGQNAGPASALLCDAIQWYANLASRPPEDWRTYAWSLLTRLTALSFVGICGAAMTPPLRPISNAERDGIQKYLQALGHSTAAR